MSSADGLVGRGRGASRCRRASSTRRAPSSRLAAAFPGQAARLVHGRALAVPARRVAAGVPAGSAGRPGAAARRPAAASSLSAIASPSARSRSAWARATLPAEASSQPASSRDVTRSRGSDRGGPPRRARRGRGRPGDPVAQHDPGPAETVGDPDAEQRVVRGRTRPGRRRCWPARRGRRPATVAAPGRGRGGRVPRRAGRTSAACAARASSAEPDSRSRSAAKARMLSSSR